MCILSRYNNIDEILSIQMHINKNHSSILIGWMLDIAQEYNLYPEATLYAILLHNVVLSKKNITIGEYQCMGMACMDIAQKLIHDIQYIPIEEWIDVSENSVSIKDFIEMEDKIMQLIDYNLYKYMPDFTNPNVWAMLLSGLCMYDLTKNNLELFKKYMQLYVVSNHLQNISYERIQCNCHMMDIECELFASNMYNTLHYEELVDYIDNTPSQFTDVKMMVDETEMDVDTYDAVNNLLEFSKSAYSEWFKQ